MSTACSFHPSSRAIRYANAPSGYSSHATCEDEASAIRRRQPILVRWMPPSPRRFKLNCDGSSLGNPGPASYGGLIRDHHGVWIHGYVGKIGRYTSIVAEIWGIFRGLCLIKLMGLNGVVIETDCRDALLLITVKNVENHPQGQIIKNCRKLMEDCGCCIVHVKREGNHCADQMAKLGGKQVQEFAVLKDPPQALIPFLLADAAGQWYERPPRSRS